MEAEYWGSIRVAAQNNYVFGLIVGFDTDQFCVLPRRPGWYLKSTDEYAR